jgi:antitoxin (DNA-binding transcriptional repressor) of toxin-antitoxin stability system
LLPLAIKLNNVIMTETVSMVLAKALLSELASRTAAGERFVILRRGKPVAGLVSAADVARLESAGWLSSFMEAIAAFRHHHRGRLPTKGVHVRRTPARRVR